MIIFGASFLLSIGITFRLVCLPCLFRLGYNILRCYHYLKYHPKNQNN